MTWKPIKTAPRGPEGKSQPFLAYAPPDADSEWITHENGRYAVCYYSCSDTLCELVTQFMFDEETEDQQEEFKPTHWMPLPEPPKLP